MGEDVALLFYVFYVMIVVCRLIVGVTLVW